MRTTPSGIQALRGLSEPGAPILLVAIAGVGYYSSSSAVTFGGNTYVANRVKSIGSFDAMYVDRKVSNVSSVSIVLDNLADNGSSSFPFTVLDASINYEDRVVTIYAYSTVANDALIVWSGFAQRPNFDGANKLVTLSASHFWVALDMPAPSKLAHQSGFNPTAIASTSNDNLSAESAIPLVWGVDNFKIRPLIYRTRVDGSVLRVNFIVSGTQSGVPFNAADVIAANVKLFNVTPASIVQFFTGGADSSVAPVNLTKFPDGVSHALVAYGYAEFPITNEQKDQIDNLQPDDIKMTIVNGRPLVDTAIPSENAALILKDFLRDPNFSIGLPNAIFDSTVLTSTANYVGTRYQVRYELHEQKSVAERVQQLLADFHGFITFDNGLIQIRCKKNTEASVATFATIDSGQAGRKIHDDFIKSAYENDASQVINQVTVDYRLKKRNNRTTTLYDPNAQTRAGLTYKKVVEDKYELLGLFDETQVQINAAIVVREEQNGNLYIEFESLFWDCIDVSPGDVITVYSPDIPNNGSNYLFRVVGQSIDVDSSYLVSFKCQVYKSAVYNDDASALGVDLLRGASDTSQQGRPPDVVPVSLNIIDIVSSDTQGKTATLRGVWTYPTVDLTTEQAEGTFREYPIAQVDLMWHYTDESINAARLGASVVYPTAQADFQIDYYKSRSVECFFVAIGHNRARSSLGYIPHPTKVTSLTAAVNSSQNTYPVADASLFTPGDYVQIEREINALFSKTPTQLTLVGFRTTYFDTTAIAHPSGTEVAVAKLSYPSLTKALNVPRFTYPVVQNLLAKQRDASVKFHWDDPNADNQEKFYLYVSEDSDANTNTAKLGVNNPTWYLTDPTTPPAGIVLFIVDTPHFDVPQETFAGSKPNTTMWGRVAARNGKQNYSATLSGLANQKSSGHGLTPVFAPADPVLGDITNNVSPLEIVHKQAPVTFQVWADSTHLKSFNDAGGNRIGIGIAWPLDSNTILPDANRVKFYKTEVADPTQVSAKITVLLPIGQKLFFYQVFDANGNDRVYSNTVNTLAFTPGNYSTDPTALTTFTLAATPVNSKYTDLDLHIVQPSSGLPVIGKNVWWDRKLPTDADYVELSDKVIPLRDAAFSVLGADFHLRASVKHPAGITGISYRARYVAQGGTVRSVTVGANSNTDESVPIDTQVPGGTGAVLTAPTCSFEDGKLTIQFNVNAVTFMNTHLYNRIRLATLSETVASFNITNAPNTASRTTVTTSAAHGFSVGQTVVISGIVGNTVVNGTWVVVTVPSTTTFKIAVSGSGAYVSGGTVSLPGAFLDIPTKTLTSDGSASKLQIHKAGHHIVSIKLRKLRDIFGALAHIAVRYYITNSVGESGSALTDVDLNALTDLHSETGIETGAGIPAKTLAISSINVTPGGAFIASKDAYDALGDVNIVGQEWRDRPFRGGGTAGNRIDTTGTARGLKWNKTNHWIEAATNVFTLGGEICCFIPIRPFLPGDTWSEGISIKLASGTYQLNAFTFSLFDEGNALDIPGTPITLNSTDDRPVILTTAFQVVGAVFSVDTAYVPGTTPRRQWLRIKFGENPPVVMHFTNNMANRGSQILPWGPALEDKSVASDIDPSASTGSGSAGSGGGGGNGSGGGATGGGFGPGAGGYVPY